MKLSNSSAILKALQERGNIRSRLVFSPLAAGLPHQQLGLQNPRSGDLASR